MRRATRLAAPETLERRLALSGDSPTALAFWEFEDDLTDSSGGGLNATVGGGSPGFVDELGHPFSTSLNLNGVDDFVDISAVAPLVAQASSSGFSVSFWLKTDGGSTERAIIGVSNSLGDEVFGVLLTQADELAIWDGSSDSVVASTGIAVADSQLHHIAYVVDNVAAEGKVYIDGVLAATHQPGWVCSGSDQWSVGKLTSDSSDNRFLAATLDNLKVYDAALTDSEVVAQFTHAGEEGLQSEHSALLSLAPAADATHTAVQSGAWSDTATWDGAIPGAGAKVLVPDGVTITYDIVNHDALYWIRVDGRLEFATQQDTLLKLDTLIVTPSGVLTIGSVSNPVAAGVAADIVIADNGPIDLEWDPTQLSRGVISHGAVEIHGQQKTSFLRTAQDPMLGDNTILLESVPQNWSVGDRIVLTGTYLVDPEYSQDEELVIVALNGNEVTVDRGLIYDHDGPEPDLKAYVANYSRNVRLSTENYALLPASQRGHVMFMHNDDVDVRYAEFYELGRTDKSILLDDFLLDENGLRVLDNGGDPWTDPTGTPLAGASTNIRGRYSFHVHSTGVDGTQPVIAIGNAVWGSPGWGYVHHNSNALFQDNAAYNTFGAGFVAETGNETGAWTGNISIKSPGDPTRGVKAGKDNHDIATTGSGFWLQGRLVEMHDNVSASNGGAAYTYFIRGIDQILNLTTNLPFPEISRTLDEIDPNLPPIREFVGNEAFGSFEGLVIVKGTEHQHHDVRSVLEGFIAWEVHEGMHLQYTSKYTIKNARIIHSRSHPGVYGAYSIGVNYQLNVADVLLRDSVVTGFDFGVDLKKHTALNIVPESWQYTFLDVDLSGNTSEFRNFDPLEDRVITAAGLSQESPRLIVTADSDVNFSPDLSDRAVVIKGWKIDSLGTDPFLPSGDSLELYWKALTGLLGQGYYQYPNGAKVLLMRELISDRATGDVFDADVHIVLDSSWDTYLPNDLLLNAPYLGPLDPHTGDFNQNGVIDSDDIAILRAGAQQDDLAYDLNGDQVVDDGIGASGAIQSDLDELIRRLAWTDYGDANLDGRVDIADATTMVFNWNSGGGWTEGDFTGDGMVTIADANALAVAYGATADGSRSSILAAEIALAALADATDERSEAASDPSGVELAPLSPRVSNPPRSSARKVDPSPKTPSREIPPDAADQALLLYLELDGPRGAGERGGETNDSADFAPQHPGDPMPLCDASVSAAEPVAAKARLTSRLAKAPVSSGLQ